MHLRSMPEASNAIIGENTLKHDYCIRTERSLAPNFDRIKEPDCIRSGHVGDCAIAINMIKLAFAASPSA